MKNYRAYVVGENGSFASSVQIQEEDDALAVERARLLLDKFDVEVWEGVRFIVRLDAMRDAALMPVSLPASQPAPDETPAAASGADDTAGFDPDIFADVEVPAAVYKIPEASVGAQAMPRAEARPAQGAAEFWATAHAAPNELKPVAPPPRAAAESVSGPLCGLCGLPMWPMKNTDRYYGLARERETLECFVCGVAGRPDSPTPAN